MAASQAERGVTSYKDVLLRCEQESDAIRAHFPGGVAALHKAALADLRPVPWKWRKADESNESEWIPGGAFRQIIRSKRDGPGAGPEGPNDELRNWFDRAGSLREVVRICERHGPDVLVGFEGGRGALRRATYSYLVGRDAYKWDWTLHPVGAKDMSNWIGGDEFLAILRESGHLPD
jgi:hypothetical protein